MDDERTSDQARPVLEIAVRGMGASIEMGAVAAGTVEADVHFSFEGSDGRYSGPDLRVRLMVPWDRGSDTFDDLQRKLVHRALKFLGYAAALDVTEAERLLEASMVLPES